MHKALLYKKRNSSERLHFPSLDKGYVILKMKNNEVLPTSATFIRHSDFVLSLEIEVLSSISMLAKSYVDKDTSENKHRTQVMLTIFNSKTKANMYS